MLFALGSCVCPGAALMSGHNCMAYKKEMYSLSFGGWQATSGGQWAGSLWSLAPWRLLAFLGCGRGTPASASTVLW